MPPHTRRRFLTVSTAITAAPLVDLSFLAPLNEAIAAEPTALGQVSHSPSINALVKLIRATPRADLIAAFVGELSAGLSYHDFLSALFVAALEHGDPHQVAQVYSAHRVSSESRREERLLPLFWALDRIGLGFEQESGRQVKPLGRLPAAGDAAAELRAAMSAQNADRAEHAIVALARSHGPRHALGQLWAYSARRTAGTLGHHPIMAANAWRTLEALAWQRPEPVLRYLAAAFSQYESDRTYEPNLQRVERVRDKLPPGWAANTPDREATLDLYAQLRTGQTDQACQWTCDEVAAGRVAAGAAWDAIHLTASDLIHRYKTGGGPIGGSLIHAVTSTNALRLAFNMTSEDRVRLLLLLQATGALGDVFHDPAAREGQLREMHLLELGETRSTQQQGRLEDVFAMLPRKAFLYTQERAEERTASDEACRLAFAVFHDPSQIRTFTQMARGLLCAKATLDPHDVKYPVAIFEDVRQASAPWRPFLLASSVHALHGTASADSPVLVKARDALKTVGS